MEPHLQFQYSMSCSSFRERSSGKEGKEKIVNLFDFLDNNIGEIVRTFYEGERFIFNNGFLSEELKEKLTKLKHLNYRCKKMLDLPNPDEINLPEDFISEYKELVFKVSSLIEKTKDKINSIRRSEENFLYIKENEEKLLKLNILREHYENAVGG